jgi:hypothetical protein
MSFFPSSVKARKQVAHEKNGGIVQVCIIIRYRMGDMPTTPSLKEVALGEV